MLEPQDRRVLLEALRPPGGYTVDRALATTFSLDLIALLTAPLAFSLYDQLVERESGDGEGLDGLALLQAVRAHAERLSVFCEAGRISHPGKYRPLLTYLEDALVPVGARQPQGVFHPKIWVQRFTPTFDPDEPIRYRLLCLTRNLTFDRSWDSVLVLDGVLKDRDRAIADNHPLGEFLESLPDLALRPPSRRIAKDVELLAQEIRRVDFERPEGIESIQFWPLGHDDRRRDPFSGRIERLLVISPFLSPDRLGKLTTSGKKNILVSRLEHLEQQPAHILDRFSSVYVLSDGAEGEPDDDDAPESLPLDATAARGLHAKLYVADDGWSSHLWTGSANATEAAFSQNVEFLVQLTGKKSKFGVEALLTGADGNGGLQPLLSPFTPPREPKLPDPVEERLDAQLQALRRQLARTHWSARVTRAAEGGESYDVTLWALGDGVVLDTPGAVRVWPITLSDTRAQTLKAQPPGPVFTFASCSFQALTPFFAFDVRVSEGTASLGTTFVVPVPLEGAPGDRHARVLQGMLDDPAKVMRFLRLLLATDVYEVMSALEAAFEGTGTRTDRPSAASELPLLEVLLKAVSHDRPKLDAVARLVQELRQAPGGEALLPPDFESVWEAVWTAARTLDEPRGKR